MQKLIDKQKAKEFADTFFADPILKMAANALLDNAPTEELPRGYDTGRCRIFHCSECGYGVNDIFQEDERNYPVGEFNYCPNCGAKMDTEERHGGE